MKTEEFSKANQLWSTQPKEMRYYRKYGNTINLVFNNKSEATSFIREVTQRGKVLPKSIEGEKLWFNQVKVGKAFEMHKATGIAINAFRTVLCPDEAMGQGRSKVEGDRRTGTIYFERSEVGKVEIAREGDAPILKLDRKQCANKNVDTTKVNDQFKTLYDQSATRFS